MSLHEYNSFKVLLMLILFANFPTRSVWTAFHFLQNDLPTLNERKWISQCQCCVNIDGLHLFWFFRKIAEAHISGRQNKNKLKENHAESSEQLVNRVPTSLCTSFVSVDFEKNMSDSCAAFRCTNRRSTTSLQFYRIPSAKRYPEQGITKWVTAKNDWLRK